MRRSANLLLSHAALIGLVILGVTPVDAQDTSVLEAVMVKRAPKLDGKVESLWKNAKPLTIKVMDGANLPGGETEVILKAVYTQDMVYFLTQYKDATQSFRRAPWQKQADGSWKQLADSQDKGGDNNVYYEDKLAWAWNINTPDFETVGCAIACHVGEGKPYGNKYTSTPGATFDLWHLKGVRTAPVGQIDDGYVDSTLYNKEKNPNAGRKTDPKTAGGYIDNWTDDKKLPKYARKGNKPAPPYWIIDSEKTAFDDAKYKPGDEVPGILIAPFVGDRGDVAVSQKWTNGVWTIEIARKLSTGSPYDVQFNDLKKTYPFGVAVFDNAQVRHAYDTSVRFLAFK